MNNPLKALEELRLQMDRFGYSKELENKWKLLIEKIHGKKEGRGKFSTGGSSTVHSKH